MVQVLDRIPSFGENFAKQFTSGLAGGLNKGFEAAQKLAGKDPYRQQQLASLAAERLSSRYNRAIKEIDSGINVGIYGHKNSPEFLEAMNKRKKLTQERDKTLNLIQNKEEEAEVEELEEEALPKVKKVKFNSSNPEHVKKFKQLEKQFKGDKSKVNQALSREFE